MRVIDPRQFQSTKPARRRVSKRGISLIIILVIAIMGVLFLKSSADNPILDKESEGNSNFDSGPTEQSSEVATESVKDTIRVFTDEEFRVFYDNYLLPDLERVENPSTITGNDIADARIIKITEDRGYRLRSSPSISLIKIDGYFVQPRILESWQSLKKSAKSNGFSLVLTSAYRSVDLQRELFLNSLSSAGLSVSQIAEGLVDDKVNKVLETAAPPAYSKHHTGYTIDIACDGVGSHALKKTACYKWLSANNFANSKEFGWLPSYPETAQLQGPEPEPWELVWAGRDALLE